MMTQFLTVTVLLAYLCASAGLGQTADTLVQVATSASPNELNFRDPKPYLVADTSFRVPPQPLNSGSEKPAYGEIQAVYAATDNSGTIIRVEYKPGTDAQRMAVRFYIDSDGNPRTGSGIGYWLGQNPIDGFGFDHEIVVGWFGISVRAQNAPCCLDGYAEVRERASSSVTIRIANSLFGDVGRSLERKFQATLFDTGTGVSLSVAPANGVASIPSTVMVTLSPATGTKLYKVGQADTIFDLVADFLTIVPEQQASLFVRVNGENMTPVFLANFKTGTKYSGMARIGGPNYFAFTKRFSYPIDSIIRGGGKVRVELVLLTAEGLAFDEVTYTAEGIMEFPDRP